MSLEDNAISVTLQVRDMSQFASLNALYVKHFNLKPPVRVCVQCEPSDRGEVGIQVFACTKELLVQRENMHVQSISRWAPPNIGPYSQSNVFRSTESQIMFLAGQIGMDPGTLDLIGSP